MDPLSIIAGCVALTGTALTVSDNVRSFARRYSSASSDLDAVLQQLQSLQQIVNALETDLLRDSGITLPIDLKDRLLVVINNCCDVLKELDNFLKRQARSRAGEALRWSMTGREELKKLQRSLEAHQFALTIALQHFNMSITQDIRIDTNHLRRDSEAIRSNTDNLMAEIRLLRRFIEYHSRSGDNDLLQRFLDSLTEAQSVSGESVMAQNTTEYDFDALSYFTDAREEQCPTPSSPTDDFEYPETYRRSSAELSDDHATQITSISSRSNSEAYSHTSTVNDAFLTALRSLDFGESSFPPTDLTDVDAITPAIPDPRRGVGTGYTEHRSRPEYRPISSEQKSLDKGFLRKLYGAQVMSVEYTTTRITTLRDPLDRAVRRGFKPRFQLLRRPVQLIIHVTPSEIPRLIGGVNISKALELLDIDLNKCADYSAQHQLRNVLILISTEGFYYRKGLVTYNQLGFAGITPPKTSDHEHPEYVQIVEATTHGIPTLDPACHIIYANKPMTNEAAGIFAARLGAECVRYSPYWVWEGRVSFGEELRQKISVR